MIRADWTPLWAAHRSNREQLGPKQVACLELLRDRGPLTHNELLAAGFGLPVRDSLTISARCCPPLVDFDTDRPQRYFLAAPSQLAELQAVLSAIRDGHELPSRAPMRWRGSIELHIERAGLARWSKDGQRLIPPRDQAASMTDWARKIARAMVVHPLAGVA
jgi:hypothetical protein